MNNYIISLKKENKILGVLINADTPNTFKKKLEGCISDYFHIDYFSVSKPLNKIFYSKENINNLVITLQVDNYKLKKLVTINVPIKIEKFEFIY